MKKKILWSLPLLTWVGIAQAEPTLYPPDINVLSSIKNTTNSNILADEKDPQTVWVMPPNTAMATVSSLHSKTANMGRCVDMRDLQADSRSLAADVKLLTKKKVAKFDELQLMLKKADLLEQEAASFAVDRGLTALTELDTRIQDAEQRLMDLYNQSDKCKANCDQIAVEISDLLKAKAQMLKDRNELARQNANDAREYTRRKKLAEAATLAYKNAKNSYTEIAAEISSVEAQFSQRLDYFGKLEGARAAIKYTSSWDSNVASLREANPGINFSKVATKEAVLMTEIAGIQDMDSQGAIKSIGLGGVMKNGVAAFEVYPESISTNVVLSLIGACPMEHPEYFDLKTNSASDMEYGLVITYKYDSIFTTKATVGYNMYKMYQKIVSSGSSGGLFSSRSWTNVEEKNFFKDSFTVEWDVRESLISQEDKDAREKEMRLAVLSRLAAMALPTTANRGEVLAAAAPPTRGAVVLSDSLMQTCPGNVYCMGASVVLKVLDAIFGSSSSTATYTNIQDITLYDRYAETGKITKSWITSYLKQ